MIWLKNTMPAWYNGFPILIESSEGKQQFKLAASSPVGFSGGYQEPMGAEAREIQLRVVFPGSYFEGHKIFLQLLDGTIIPMAPGILMHPVYGVMDVYPASYTHQIEAAEQTAVVDVVFHRHVLIPETYVPTGVFFAATLFGESVVRDAAAGYLAMLAFMAAWNVALLSAGLMVLRVFDIATTIVNTPQAWADAFGAFASGWVRSAANLFDPKGADPAKPETSPNAFTRGAFGEVDRLLTAVHDGLHTPMELFDAVAAGGAYDAGIFADGRPRAPGFPSPSPRFHAAVTVAAVVEAQTAGSFAERLTRILIRQAQSRSVSRTEAIAAITQTRRRLARASALAQAAMGVHAAPVVRALSDQGAQLLRLLSTVPDQIPATRTVVLDRPRPVAVIALDELGDAERAEEIHRLNPLLANLDRLPIGQTLVLPAA